METLSHLAKTLFEIDLLPWQINALNRYEEELIAWNKKFNLTAIDHPEQIRVKHFLDSFSAVKALKATPMNRIIDVGTGAGFPGLPLKILYPDTQLTLVESIGKKADFCRHIVTSLGLSGVQVVQERAETVGQHPDFREQYDWAIARAVASMPVLAEYLLPLIHIGGYMLAMKGETGPAEAQEAESAIHLLGGSLHKVIPVTLPTVVEERFLVVIKKVATTPPQYPRRVGIPNKRPLKP